MSYVANGEKVFLYQNPYANCTPPTGRRSDHRLKRFQSVLDKRAWHFCEEVRSKHFRDLMSVSQTCLGADPCHKYVPLEDLIRILMSEKDEMIKQLQQRGMKGGPGVKGVKGFSAGKVPLGDKDDITQTARLREELDKSRDMLRKAMHKLENIDEIVNENKKLQCRLRCSEERVKYLEDKKKDLETELADLRSRSQIQMDLEKAQQMLCQISKQKSSEIDEAVLNTMSLERDELQEKVKKLERELEESKKKDVEIELLKKQSQSDSIDREEMSRENECYRRKLASMKCLEKQIQELKKQGKALADKYKREAQKAAEQMNKMYVATKELQGLRDERDSLRKRVNELASYECQYKKLQRKLQRVDAVIAENETLNCKLMALEKLEKENEYLRCRLEAIQEMEMNAAGDKEKIVQLQCAVADQEEEMKDLLGQIERLTSGKNEEELERLRCELYEKNSRLKLCEEQLAEIPMLEAEIDELRMKLQSCCKEFPETKRGERSYQKLQVRLPASSTGIYADYKTPGEHSSVLGIRREERVELKNKYASCQEISQVDTGRDKIITESSKKGDVMSCDEVQNLLQSSKGIISCVLDDMREHQKEMEELETCNKAMKEEIESLKAKVGGSDKDCLFQEINQLKKALEEKDELISKLKQSGSGTENSEDIEAIKELNRQMKIELEAACIGLKQVAHLEKLFGKGGGQEGAEGGSKRRGVDDPEFDSCRALQKETDDLKLQVEALNKLTEELKKENELLRELQQPCPDFSKELDEKCALENLLSLLQAELDAFKGQKLSDECEALRMELKRVMEQNCQLKTLVDCYRQRLNLEKESSGLTSQQVGVGGKFPPESNDCMKELEQLRKEKNILQKKIDLVAQGVPLSQIKLDIDELSAPGKGTGAGGKGTGPLGAETGKDQTSGAGGTGTGASGAGAGADDKSGAGGKGTGPLGARAGADETSGAGGTGTGASGAGAGADDKSGAGGKGTGAPGAEAGADETSGAGGADGTTGAGGKGTGPSGADGTSGPGGKGTGPSGAGGKGTGPSGAEAGADETTGAGGKGTGPSGAGGKGTGAPGAGAGADEKSGAGGKGTGPAGAEAGADETTDAGGKGTGPSGAGAKGTGPSSAEAGAKGGPVSAEECEEKIKKLMDQHQKELADREKKYNDNLNAMKAGYETDIRKLADRHKQSIIKLQDLHEGEMQEMSSEYERQLDESQTALNELAKSKAGKGGKGGKEGKEGKDGKEEELMGKLGTLQNRLNRSKEELDALRKSMKPRSGELQKVRRASQQKLNAMKKALDDERKRSANEIEALQRELREKGGVCYCKFSKKKSPKPRDPLCPLDFNEVLEKILEEGLDSLSFNEIALVHRKTCCALEGIVMNSNGRPILEMDPPVGESCMHTPLLEADKQQLLSKIFALENDIMQKQKETQETIISMELAIKKERCRLQEVKNSLQNEQQKNSELKILLNSHTKLQADLKKERDQMGNQASFHQSLCEEKSKRLEEEMKTKRYLEGEIERLKGTLKQLRIALDAQRESSREGGTRGENIEMMRMQLEKSTHQERKLAIQLEKETKCRMQLQYQLQSLRQSVKHMVSLPSSGALPRISQNPLEAKSVKERQNLDQINESKSKTKTKPGKKSKKT